MILCQLIQGRVSRYQFTRICRATRRAQLRSRFAAGTLHGRNREYVSGVFQFPYVTTQCKRDASSVRMPAPCGHTHTHSQNSRSSKEARLSAVYYIATLQYRPDTCSFSTDLCLTKLFVPIRTYHLLYKTSAESVGV